MSSEPLSYYRYLAAMAASAVALLAAIILFNMAMDPYFVWQWQIPGVNAYKPWIHHEGTSALAVAVHRPQTLFAGNSIVVIGFDPTSPQLRPWGKIQFAPELGRGLMAKSVKVIAAAADAGQLRHVVLLLDPRDFAACTPPAAGEDDGATAALTHILLLPALPSSLDVLAMNLKRALGRQPLHLVVAPTGLVTVRSRTADEDAQIAAHMSYGFRRLKGQHCPPSRYRAGFTELDALVTLSRQRGFDLTLFFPPMPQDSLRGIHHLGYWPAFEKLRADLAAFSGRSGVSVWDFSTVSLWPDNRVGSADFFDNVHFKPALGERILGAIRPGRTAPAGFGILLSPATAATQLTRDREAANRLFP